MAEEAEPARVTHTINLDFLRNIGMRGVNRAAGFLGLAFRHPRRTVADGDLYVEFQ